MTLSGLVWTAAYFVWILSNIFFIFPDLALGFNCFILHCHRYPCESLCKENRIYFRAGNELVRLFLTSTH